MKCDLTTGLQGFVYEAIVYDISYIFFFSFQPPHVRRKLKIQEISNKFTIVLSPPEFYTHFFQGPKSKCELEIDEQEGENLHDNSESMQDDPRNVVHLV